MQADRGHDPSKLRINESCPYNGANGRRTAFVATNYGVVQSNAVSLIGEQVAVYEGHDPSKLRINESCPYNYEEDWGEKTMAGENQVRESVLQAIGNTPVVIYSLTTSSPEEAPRGMEFLYSLNRLNVATSRAMTTVIVVGSPRLFEPECRTPRQMQLANGLCAYREMAIEVDPATI